MPSCTYRALPGNVTYFLPPPTSHQSDRQYFLKHPKTKVCNTKTKSTGSPLAKKKNHANKYDAKPVALDCSFTHLLLAANTHSRLPPLMLKKLWLYAKLSFLKDKSTFGLAPLQCFYCNPGVQN